MHFKLLDFLGMVDTIEVHCLVWVFRPTDKCTQSKQCYSNVYTIHQNGFLCLQKTSAYNTSEIKLGSGLVISVQAKQGNDDCVYLCCKLFPFSCPGASYDVTEALLYCRYIGWTGGSQFYSCIIPEFREPRLGPLHGI